VRDIVAIYSVTGKRQPQSGNVLAGSVYLKNYLVTITYIATNIYLFWFGLNFKAMFT